MKRILTAMLLGLHFILISGQIADLLQTDGVTMALHKKQCRESNIHEWKYTFGRVERI